MSDLLGNHIVGFLMRQLICITVYIMTYYDQESVFMMLDHHISSCETLVVLSSALYAVFLWYHQYLKKGFYVFLF